MDQETKFDSNREVSRPAQNDFTLEISSPFDRFQNAPTSLPQFGAKKIPQTTGHENQQHFSPFGQFHTSKSPQKSKHQPVSSGTRGQRTVSPKPYIDSQQEVIRARNQQLESSELRVSTRGISFDSQEDETQVWLRQRDADKARIEKLGAKERRNFTAPAQIQRRSDEFSSKFKRSLEEASREFSELFEQQKTLKWQTNLYWLAIVVLSVFALGYALKDPLKDRRPFCETEVVTNQCQKCPQGSECSKYEIVACRNGYRPSKNFSFLIFGDSKLRCKPDEELNRLLKSAAQEIVSKMQSATLREHCENLNITHMEILNLEKVEQEVRKFGVQNQADSLFNYNFKSNLRQG